MISKKAFKPTIEQIKEIAFKYPDKIAVQIEEEIITYRDLIRKINAFSGYLVDTKISLQENVIVLMDRSIECIVAILSVLNIGCVYIPIDPVHSMSRINHIVKDSDPYLIITSSNLVGEIDFPERNICIYDQLNLSTYNNIIINTYIDPAFVMYILYTSGTTGNPKGVLVNYEGAENLLDEIKSVWPMHKNILQFASLGFDASIPEWAGCLASGGKLIMIKNRKLTLGNELLELVSKHDISFMKMPSAVLSTLNNDFVLNKLETIVTAGDACNQELVRKWGQGRKFYNCYGPTENSIGSTRSMCSLNDEKVNIGKPVRNVYVYILDENLNPVNENEIGEIYLGGKGVSYGYVNMPDLTAEKFLPDPFNGVGKTMYKTGDLGRYLSDGNIDFVGRIDNQLKINGYRIELDEINEALKKIPEIMEGTIIPVFEERSQYLLAFYQTSNKNLDVVYIKNELKKILPGYMIPSKYQRLENFQLTPSGKIDVTYLKANYNNLLQPEQLNIEKSLLIDDLDVHEILNNLWKKVLKVEKIDEETNFFSMGGSSIDAAILIAEIEIVLGVAPSIADLYENPRFLDFELLTKKFVQAFS